MVRFLEPLRLISNEIVPQAASPRTLTKIKHTYGKPENEVMILCFFLKELEPTVLRSGFVFIAITHAQPPYGHWEYCCTT